MATTPNLNLPLITDNTANNVKRDMNALAEAVDTSVNAVSTALNESVAQAKTMANTANMSASTTQLNLITHLADNSKQVPHLGTTTNVGDAYSITTTETINANQKFTIKFNAASTSAPTLKINTGTVCPIKKANGNAAKLYASVYTLFWDGTNFILLGEGGEYGTATAAQVLTGYTFGTESGIQNGTLIPGKKSLTGTATAPDGYLDYITVNLSFKPSLIFIYANTGFRVAVLTYYSQYSTTKYNEDGQWNTITSPGYVSNTGFSLAFHLGGTKTNDVAWIAVE